MNLKHAYDKKTTPRIAQDQTYVLRTPEIKNPGFDFRKVAAVQSSRQLECYGLESTGFSQESVDDLQRQMKIKQMNYNQISEDYCRQQRQMDELKSEIQMMKQEKLELKQLLQQADQQNKYLQRQLAEERDLTQSFQQESMNEKLRNTQLENEVRHLEFELKTQQLILGGQKHHGLCLQTKDDDQESQMSSIKERKQSYAISDISNNDQIRGLQNQVKKLTSQISDKNKIIAQLSEQNKFLTQNKQAPVPEIQIAGQIVRKPKHSQTALPTQPDEIQNYNSQPLKQSFSPQESFLKFRMNSQNSIKSTLTNLNKQQVSSVYAKLNHSTMYTAGIMSSILDYQTLQKKSSEFLRSPHIEQL